MLFRRKKSKNRRLEKKSGLDLKARSRPAGLAWLKLLGSALFFSALTLAMFWGGWQGGAWALDELVFKNQTFALRSIQISTDGQIPLSLIQQWSGARLGQNIFSLDLAQMRRDLEFVPYIEKAALERVLPNRLRIDIIEREPVATLSAYRARPDDGELERQTFFLDPDGWVIPPMEWIQPAAGAGAAPPSVNLPNPAPLADSSAASGDRAPFGPLPAIIGFAGTELRPGMPVESPQIHAALELIRAFESSPMLGQADLLRIDVSQPDILVATTSQESRITFSLQDFDRQLRRWRVVREYAERSGRAIASLDLSITNNVPVRWVQNADGSPAPPVPALKPAPRRPYKHKHV